MGKLIILEGLPGVGKTLLGKSYASSNPNTVFLEEWVDVSVLKEYLSDMKGKATGFQMYIQEGTVQRIKKAIRLVKGGVTVVLDRGLAGNRCFAETQFESGLISEEDIKLYRSKFVYSAIEGFDEINCEVIYMHASPEFSLKRIRQRARDGESVYELDYLRKLCEKHDDLIVDARIVEVDTDHQLTERGELPPVAMHAVIVGSY